MHTDTAEKLKKTQGSFSSGPSGAVAKCPLADLAAAPPAAPAEEKEKEKKSWIEIAMVDTDGKPVPDIRYRITLPGGERQEGRLDDQGKARYEQIESGNCTITFPDLDQSAWS